MLYIGLLRQSNKLLTICFLNNYANTFLDKARLPDPSGCVARRLLTALEE